MLKNMMLALTAAMFFSPVYAQNNTQNAVPLASVNKSSCSKLVGTTQPFILVLDNGDDLIASINKCAKDAKLDGAEVTGIGQVQNPTLAYFSSNPDVKPSLTTFPGYYEMASLTGDISDNDNQYYTHLHAVLADSKFHGIAGHLDNTRVGLTAEIIITPFSAYLERNVNAKTGFGTIEH